MTKSFHFGSAAALPLLLTLSVILVGACSQQQQAGTPVQTPQTSPPTPAVTENPGTTANQGVVQATNPSQAGDVRTYSGTGVVTVVNHKEAWVEINHREIEGLMPAMQMAWFVKTVSLIGSVKVGDTVNFEIEDKNGSQVLTKLETVQSR